MIELGTIHKGAAEEIRFTARAFEGQEVVIARVWFCHSDGCYLPSKSGHAFPLPLLGQVLTTLGQARKAVRQ